MPAQTRRKNRRRALAAVVCLSYWSIPGHAATSTWNVASGNWSVAGNWAPSGAPLSGTVLITNTDSTNRTITFDETSTVSLTTLTIDNSGGGTDTLSMTGAGLSLASSNEYIGNSSSSTLTGSGVLIQSVGTNAVSTTLYMAYGTDDTGTYSLSGPSGTQITAGNEDIGYGGTANFQQSGGTNTDNGGFGLGLLAGSTGNYNLSGGTLIANGGEAIGEGGAGNFIQTGGTHTIASGNLNLGFSSGATGTYTLSGGTASLTSGNINVGGNASGAGGKGNLIVTSTGVLTTSSTATINVYNTTGSALTLSGGTINTGSINLMAGNPALFNWTAGTLNWNNAADSAIVDSTTAANLASTLNLGSTQTLNVAGSEEVGDNGTGSVSQSGGTNSAGYLYVGYNDLSNGTYTLSGSGTLNTPKMSIGYNGTGTFTQSGGTVNSSGFITVGDQILTTGVYNFNGGSINGNGLNLGYSDSATGTFNHTAGIASFTSVVLGQNTDASGFYNLSNSGLGQVSELDISGNEIVGNGGSGTFTQTGGQSAITGALIMGNAGGSSGAYALSGTGSLTVAQNEYVGFSGTGNFIQTGGTNTASLGLILGQNNGITGTYTLSGSGSLEVESNSSNLGEVIGYGGTGVFNQSGGTNAVSFILTLGNSAGSSGTYNLSGSGVLSSTSGEVIGGAGTGSFNQTGGLNTLGNELFVGEGDTGTYSLSGTGVLSVSGTEYVGFNSAGTFIQTGGTNKVTESIIIATDDPGTYNLSGGSATASAVTVGYSNTAGGAGIFNVSSAGTLNVTSTLTVNDNGSAFNFSGGTINAVGLNFNGVPSLFNWTGGTLNITNSVTWDSAAANTTTSDAFAASLSIGTGQTLMVTGNETLGGAGPFSLTLNNGSTHYVTGSVTLGPTGTITQNNGSTLYDSSFTQAGGTVNGTLQNQSQFIYQSGVFNGRLVNQGTVSLGPTFTAGTGILNYATISLSAGQTVIANGTGLQNLGTFNLDNATIFANGTGLDNLGTMNLNGGTISGTATAINDFSGTLQGSGIINPALTNNGNLTVAGVLQINTTIANYGVVQGSGEIIGNFSNTNGGSVDVASGNSLAMSNAWTNSSLVTLQGAGAVLGGGAIANTGTIQGAGSVNSPIANSTGVIRASGGELDLGGAGNTNGAAAQIQAATGGTVLETQGLAANAGEIALSGGTFDNNNRTLANTGYISGFGIFRSGGLTNNGFLVLGGNTNIYGPVTNAATGAVNAVGPGAIDFYGAVTNSAGGNITVQSGASATFFNSFTGTAPISNGGTVTLSINSISGAITGGGQTVVGNGISTTLKMAVTSGDSSQSSLLIDDGSTLDLTNNTFFIDYGSSSDPIASIAAYLKSGYNGGSWNGPGIISSTAATTPGYGLGYADSADPGNPAGLSSGTIEIKYTLLGDANLDGVVNAIDFGILAANFNKGVTGWDKGDFNYDNVVSAIDFGELASNFNKGASGADLGPGPLSDPALVAFAQAHGLMADVPEPVSLGLICIAAPGLLARRRKRN